MAVQKRIIFFLPTSGECIIYTLAAVEMWFPALVRGDTIPPLHHSTIAALLMDNCQTESPPDLMRWEPPCRYCNKWAQNSFSVDQYFCTLPSISCFEIEELWQVSLALSWMSECEELRSRWKTSSWQLQCRNEINILHCVLAWWLVVLLVAVGMSNTILATHNLQLEIHHLCCQQSSGQFYFIKLRASIYNLFVEGKYSSKNIPVFLPFHFSNCTTFTHYPSESTYLVDLNLNVKIQKVSKR